MKRRTPLRVVGDAARADSPGGYPYSAPAAVIAAPPDPDVKVSRADLAALCGRVLARAADIPSPAALAAAAGMIRRWLADRPRLEGSHWRRYLRKLAAGLEELAEGRGEVPFRIFGRGNGKLPFATFSTLPVFTCPGAGECARFCYSFRAWRFPAAFARQLQNTLLLWHLPHVVRAAFEALPQGVTFRLYVDGDFGRLEDVIFWMDALTERPDVRAYGYSKSWDLLALHDERGGRWPANYMLNLSSGGRSLATRGRVAALPVARGEFVCVPFRQDYDTGKRGNVGFARYEDPLYYRAVRRAAEAAGYGRKVFACPGRCGSCTPKGHACGLDGMRGVVIVNGEH